MGGGLPDQLPRPGAGRYLVEDVVVTGVQVGGQQHVLLQPHGPALLHLHRHVVDEERRRVVLRQDVDGELVADAVTAVADAEDDVVAGGVAVGVMVDDHALPQVPHTEHERLPTWKTRKRTAETAFVFYIKFNINKYIFTILNWIKHKLYILMFLM